MAVPHRFRVRAENFMGVGEASEWSEEMIIDIPPSTPSKPRIKKLSATSIQILCTCPPNGGSEVSSYRLTKLKSSSPDSTESESTQLDIPISPPSHAGELIHVVDDLLPGATYVFYVEAGNRCGWSERSVGSEDVRLDVMLPVPVSFTLNIRTATSLRIQLPTYPTIESSPAIVGCKVVAGRKKDLQDAIVVAGPAKGGEEVDVDGLVRGETYWVAVGFVGEGQDGAYSDPIQAHLA
ncbi:hypothetical protein HK097_006163, partial [Rhizophlyctis rosea]